MTPEQFVSALRARGVTLSVSSNRLRLDPGATWKALTPDEVRCLKEHRAAIKLLVNAPVPPPVPTGHATPEPPPRVYSVDCERFVTEQDLRDAGVVGTDRAAFLQGERWLREQGREERSKRATATMFESIRRQRSGTHGGYRE